MRQASGRPLWLGHAGDARTAGPLHEAGIEAVIDLARDEPPASLPRAFLYCRFPLVDGEGNPPWLLKMAVATVADLLRAGVPTLVYCGAGLSRTPAIAGAALALVVGCDPAGGLDLVTRSGLGDVTPGLWSDVVAAVSGMVVAGENGAERDRPA